MSWSYSSNIATDKDRVRFLIGDIDKCDQLLQDEEILFLLTQYDVLEAAAEAARALAARYSRLCDERVGDISKSYSQLYEHYSKLARFLSDKSQSTNLLPTLTIDDTDDTALNDRIFTRHMQEYLKDIKGEDK